MKGIPMMRKRKKDEGNEDDLEASETIHLHHLAARGSLKKMNIFRITSFDFHILLHVHSNAIFQLLPCRCPAQDFCTDKGEVSSLGWAQNLPPAIDLVFFVYQMP